MKSALKCQNYQDFSPAAPYVQRPIPTGGTNNYGAIYSSRTFPTSERNVITSANPISNSRGDIPRTITNLDGERERTAIDISDNNDYFDSESPLEIAIVKWLRIIFMCLIFGLALYTIFLSMLLFGKRRMPVTS